MPEYLPLCAFRQDLLPSPCRSCTWWQDCSGQIRDEADGRDARRRWMTDLEQTWGSVGLIAIGGNPGANSSSPPIPLASIHYAPAAALPRLRQLPLGRFVPGEAAVLFCLRVNEDTCRYPPRRILHKALGLLRERNVTEVYALAAPDGCPDEDLSCRYFSLAFLEANGFAVVHDDGNLFLMRADLRGLLAVLAQVQGLVRRLLHHEPTPSPAAWSGR